MLPETRIALENGYKRWNGVSKYQIGKRRTKAERWSGQDALRTASLQPHL